MQASAEIVMGFFTILDKSRISLTDAVHCMPSELAVAMVDLTMAFLAGPSVSSMFI